jgi:DivIVA domain-containing protein
VRALRKLRTGGAGPRRLSAEDIRTVRFSQSPMAWRGFSEEEVATYLARIAEQVEQDAAERAALRAEVDRLRNFYRNNGTDVDVVPVASRERPPPTAGDLPSRTRPRLDALTATAERYADLLTGGIWRGPDTPTPPADEARELLVHAEVSARIGYEELIAGFRAAYADQPAATATELRRTQLWLDEYTHALTRQLTALHTALDPDQG